MIKQFIENHFWIVPVVGAFLTVGLGWFIGWLMCLNTNIYELLGNDISDNLTDYDATKTSLDWMNNSANPISPMNPCNPASPVWNNPSNND